MKLNVRPQFYQDVSDGVAYLAAEADANVATAWAEAVWATVQELSRHPGLGRMRSDLPFPAVRSWRVNDFMRWLIFYGERPGELVLYRVKHGAMNLVRINLNS